MFYEPSCSLTGDTQGYFRKNIAIFTTISTKIHALNKTRASLWDLYFVYLRQ
jgi:hypothetical protein